MTKKEREQNSDAVEVKRIPARAKVSTGRPRKIVMGSMRSKVAYPTVGGTIGGSGGNFYSPELSTDFLELPQSIDEQRNYFRFWYKSDSFVAQAIDLHTELPLSKIRLGVPKAKDRKLAEKALNFCEYWCKRVSLLHRLIEFTHDYHLLGEVWIFAEDNNPEMPREIREEAIREISSDGRAIERWELRKDADERAANWLTRNYKGWTALRVLPPEQIHMEAFAFTDEKIVELIPDSKSKDIVQKAAMGDSDAERIVNSMPRDIVQAIMEGRNIPLNTDSDAGSFVYYMCRKKSQYEPRGTSILERCLLPGTPIVIKRNGIIQQVPVEDVDTQTDLLLTGKGRFRKAQSGSRPVNEEITRLYIEGNDEPLSLTSDHRVMRIRGDQTEEWVSAGELGVGDTVRGACVIPEVEAKTEINLVDWWKGRSVPLLRRCRKNSRGYEIHDREVSVAQSELTPEGNLRVSFEYGQDDAGRIESVEMLAKLIEWLQQLPEPREVSYDEVCRITGFSYDGLRCCVNRLRTQIGLKTERVMHGRGKGNGTRWFPLSGDVKVPGQVVSRVLESPVSRIPLTKDFMYLLGTWLGDGCAWTKECNLLNTHSLTWTFGKGDTDRKVRERVTRIMGSMGIVLNDNLFGQDDADLDATQSRIEDQLLTRWFMEEFGHGATGKHLPEWVFNLPENLIHDLLRGLLDTDGYLHWSSARAVIDVVLDNHLLIYQLHLLCNRMGFKTQVKVRRQPDRDWKRKWATKGGMKEKTYHYDAKDFYGLSCCSTDDVRDWAAGSVKGEAKLGLVERIGRTGFFRADLLTRKVRKVEKAPYEGLVFSFDVDDDKSLVAGYTIVHNCLRILVFRDKLRQAETSIASRHMTPIRIIWAEGMDKADIEELRDQVDMALADPDFSIVTNFQVNWEEMGSESRVPDWSNLYDRTDRQMYAGLGVTESLLSGESSYSGDRINLEVINTRYMLLREILQDLIEEQFFKPMCKRMGFIEKGEYDDEVVIYPTVSFTRLALRDNSDTFDHLFNLYQKGSLDIDVILELLNIDPTTTREKLERDLWTVNDSQFNEMIRAIYGDVGPKLVESSGIVEMIAKKNGLKYTPPKDDEGSRF